MSVQKYAGWVRLLILLIAAAAGGVLVGGLLWTTLTWVFD